MARRRSTVFTLPPEAFEDIWKQMGVGDLFTLSTCSKRSFNLVKNSVHRYKSPESENPFVLSVSFDSMGSVSLEYEENSEVVWYFNGKRESERFEMEDKPQRSVKMDCGQYNEKAIVFRQYYILSHCYKIFVENHIQEMLQFVEHLSTLFNASVKKLGVAPEATDHLEAIQSVPILKKCAELEIYSSAGMISGTISHEAMQLAVEGFDCEKVILFCSFDRHFTLPLECSCEYLYLYNNQVTDQHLNVYLHQWVQSTYKKPAGLMITARGIRNNCGQYGIYDDECSREPGTAASRKECWDLREIAQGLTGYVINYSKKENCVIFQRDTDGMLLRLQIFYESWGPILHLSDNRKDHWTYRRVAIAKQ